MSADALRLAFHLASALRCQWAAPQRQRSEQERRLARQLRFAARAVPHYRRSLADVGLDVGSVPLEQLPSLPLVDRASIQRDPEGFLAESGRRETWRTSRTSGSTGMPLVTWFDPGCWVQLKLALKLRRLLACGWRPGRRLLVLEAIPPDEIPRHAADARLPGEQWLDARRFLSLFEPPEAHLACFEQFRPEFVYAPPSYLVELAPHWVSRLRGRVPLQVLMTSSEWAPPDMRARLRRDFGAPLLDVYGSTEFKEIAWQCPLAAGYHVNAESVIVEVVDEAGRPVQEGETGEIVVTSLTNRAMPLVRYATGDRARRLEGRCACGRGSPLIDTCEGRVADTVRLGTRAFSPYELTTAVEGLPGVLQYRFTQSSPDELDVELVLANAAAPDTLAAVREALATRLGAAGSLRVRRVAEIPRRSSGKRRLVEVAPRQPAS